MKHSEPIQVNPDLKFWLSSSWFIWIIVKLDITLKKLKTLNNIIIL